MLRRRKGNKQRKQAKDRENPQKFVTDSLDDGFTHPLCHADSQVFSSFILQGRSQIDVDTHMTQILLSVNI